MKQSKPWYTSKVVWLNVITFLIAAVAVVQTSPLFPAGWGEAAALVVALLNLVLRFSTSQALHVGDKERW